MPVQGTLRQKRVVASLAIGVAFALIATWMAWRYFGAPIITTLDGREVRDLSVAEVGGWAGDEYTEIRREYLTNLEQYKQLPLEPASVEPERATRTVGVMIDRELAADSRNEKALSRLPRGAIDDLKGRAGLALARASGMPAGEYLKQQDADTALVAPPTLSAEDARAVAVATERGAGAEELAQIFLELSRDAEAHEANRLVGWAMDASGSRIAVGIEPVAETVPNTLLNRLLDDPEQKRLFRGALSQGSHMFHAPSDGWPGQLPGVNGPRDRVWFEMAVVVENEAGDRFPLWMSFAYDDKRSRWWLTGVYRLVSIRVTAAPPLVF